MQTHFRTHHYIWDSMATWQLMCHIGRKYDLISSFFEISSCFVLLTMPRAICQAKDFRSVGKNDSQSSLHSSSIFSVGESPSWPEAETTIKGIARSSNSGSSVTSWAEEGPAISSKTSVLFLSSPPSWVGKMVQKAEKKGTINYGIHVFANRPALLGCQKTLIMLIDKESSAQPRT